MSERKFRASRRFLEVERPTIGERLDFSEIVRRQMDRCLQSASDEIMYAANVKALEALIPVIDITEEYIKEVEACTEEVQYMTPVTCCGVPIKEDVIPAMVETTVEVDWHGRFQAAINLFSGMGITWRRIPKAAF